jgi:hypothetical protein
MPTESQFPNSIDDFPVKSPGDVEDAEDINRYFSAVENLESFALSGNFGGQAAALDSDGRDNFGASFLVAYATAVFSFQSPNGSGAQTLTVPAAFGTSPFSDPTFGVVLSASYIAPSGSVKGFWAGLSPSTSYGTVFKDMMAVSPPLLGVTPSTGSQFTLFVQLCDPTVATSASGVATDDFQSVRKISWKAYESGSAFSLGKFGSNKHLLISASEKTRSSGVYLDSKSISKGQYVEFDLLEASTSSTASPSGVIGPCLRFVGSSGNMAKNCRFYALNLHSKPVTETNRTFGSIVWVQDPDLHSSNPPTVQVLSGQFPLKTPASAGAASVRYRFEAITPVIGTTDLYVYEKVGSGSWQLVASATHSSTGMVSGLVGFVSKRPKTYAHTARVDNVSMGYNYDTEFTKVAVSLMYIKAGSKNRIKKYL